MFLQKLLTPLIYNTMTQDEAYEIIMSWANVMLWGDAGTGKSWLTQKVIADYRKKGKTVIVTAPTGVAAINVGGATLHSAFKVFGMYPIRRNVSTQDIAWNSVDLVVIDEISMVGPDILDQIDYVLRSCARYGEPFGWIQVLLVGDAWQLKPVYAPHTARDKQAYQDVLTKYNNQLTFNASDAFKKWWFKKCHLTEAKRQSDPEFLHAINILRDGNSAVLSLFNSWVGDADTVHLMPTNDMVDEYNATKYHSLDGTEFRHLGIIIGDFNTRNAITPVDLRLKRWCRVMLTKNLKEYWLVNGDLGWVQDTWHEYIDVKFDRFEYAIPIEIATWKQIEYIGNDEVEIGSYKQFPLKLSWAITVHKSQGLTLDNVCVHVTQWMRQDLLYVWVSRASNMEKLFINRR